VNKIKLRIQMLNPLMCQSK